MASEGSRVAYAQARKTAALTVKKSRMQSWENFGHKLDYWQAKKVFWKIIRRLRGKKSSISRSIKD